MDKEKFKAQMSLLSEVFNREVSQALFETYMRILDKYTDAQIETAISRAIVELKFFPKPFELIELIEGPKGSVEDRALVEASTVLNAIKRIGHGASVKFEDPVTNAVVQQVYEGWYKLSSTMLVDEEKWFMKDFPRYYASYYRSGIKNHDKLPGLVEMQNIQNGYLDEVPDDQIIKSLSSTTLDDTKLLEGNGSEKGRSSDIEPLS